MAHLELFSIRLFRRENNGDCIERTYLGLPVMNVSHFEIHRLSDQVVQA